MILDKNYSDLFKLLSDRSSTSYFQVPNDETIKGWRLYHCRLIHLISATKKVNYHNSIWTALDYSSLRNARCFPGHFCLHVKNTEHRCTTDLDSNILFCITVLKTENQLRLSTVKSLI